MAFGLTIVAVGAFLLFVWALMRAASTADRRSKRDQEGRR